MYQIRTDYFAGHLIIWGDLEDTEAHRQRLTVLFTQLAKETETLVVNPARLTVSPDAVRMWKDLEKAHLGGIDVIYLDGHLTDDLFSQHSTLESTDPIPEGIGS